MLSYFELYLPQKQIDVINDVLKNKIELIFEIYQILLQKLSKIVRIINTLKSTYKTFYYYCTLNIHNQIKYIIKSLTKLLKAEVNNSKKYKEINKIIKKCNKLRDKYIKTLKELYKDESIYKLFKKISDNKRSLISNNKNIINTIPKNIDSKKRECKVFGKKVKILRKTEILQQSKNIFKELDKIENTKIRIGKLSLILDTIFESFNNKKLYIPIYISFKITKYRYLDIKELYKFIKEIKNYPKKKQFFKDILSEIKIKDILSEIKDKLKNKIILENISEKLSSNKVYVLTCINNKNKNVTNKWRKLNFSKFINDFLFTLKYDSISKKSIELNDKKLEYSLIQLVKYMININIYKKYTNSIWGPDKTIKELTDYYQKLNKNKGFTDNIITYDCFISNILNKTKDIF